MPIGPRRDIALTVCYFGDGPFGPSLDRGVEELGKAQSVG